jgi:general secretion pathway protein A
MFRDHFGLHADPFALSPSLKFLYMSKALEETMAHLAYGLEQGEDFILITGAIGTGKTIALHNLIAQVSTSFHTVLLNVTQLNYLELLKMVASDLKLPLPDHADKADVLAALKEYLVNSRAGGRKLLLIIDEAQNLSNDTLEGVRMLTNLGQPGDQCLQIVLAGQPGLQTNIMRPELAQLRQRIRIHYCLQTLDRQDLENYVNHRLGVAGRQSLLFSARALDKIFRASSGVPRLVNILGSRALLTAYVDGSRSIEVRHVEVDESAPVSVNAPEVAMEPPKPMYSPGREPPAHAAPKPVPEPTLNTALAADGEVGDHGAREHPDAGLPNPFAVPGRSARRRAIQQTYWIAAVIIVVLLVIFFAWPYLSGGGPYRHDASPRLSERLSWPDVAGRGQRTGGSAPLTAGSDAGTEHPGQNDATDRQDLTEPIQGEPGRQEAAADSPTQARDETSGSGRSPVAGPGSSSADRQSRERAENNRPVTSDKPLDSPLPTTGFGIHVASFTEIARAESYISDLNGYGYPAFFVAKHIGEETWHRVYVGPYTRREQAQRASQVLQSRGLASYYFITKFGNG